MQTTAWPSPYKGFRYSQEIISHAVWLYFRFSLSYRDVEELLAERGIVVTYETIRQWTRMFGQTYANQLRRRRARPGDKWFLDVRRFTQCLIPIADGKGYEGDLWVNQRTSRCKPRRDHSMLVTQEADEDVWLAVLLDPRATVRAALPEPQLPVMQCHVSRDNVYRGISDIGRGRPDRLNLRVDGRCSTRARKEPTTAPTSRSDVKHCGQAGSPTGRAPYGDGASIVGSAWENHVQGEGKQVLGDTQRGKVREMRSADTILGIIHDRGTRGLPLERVDRLLFNRNLFLLAYGRIYRNAGAMSPGSTPETADGMAMAKIDAIIAALRHERDRWTPVRRISIEKARSTKQRPRGLPTWSDKLVQEVMRLILDAY